MFIYTHRHAPLGANLFVLTPLTAFWFWRRRSFMPKYLPYVLVFRQYISIYILEPLCPGCQKLVLEKAHWSPFVLFPVAFLFAGRGLCSHYRQGFFRIAQLNIVLAFLPRLLDHPAPGICFSYRAALYHIRCFCLVFFLPFLSCIVVE